MRGNVESVIDNGESVVTGVATVVLVAVGVNDNGGLVAVGVDENSVLIVPHRQLVQSQPAFSSASHVASLPKGLFTQKSQVCPVQVFGQLATVAGSPLVEDVGEKTGELLSDAAVVARDVSMLVGKVGTALVAESEVVAEEDAVAGVISSLVVSTEVGSVVPMSVV